VDLVEYEKRSVREFPLQYSFPVLGNVPVKVVLPVTGHLQGKRGLPHLPGPPHEDHLPPEVLPYLLLKVPDHGHWILVISIVVKYTRQ
jgi:hypothetical protein